MKREVNDEKEWRIVIHSNPDGIPTLEIKRWIEQSTLQGVNIFLALFFWYPVVWISSALAYLFQSNKAYEIYKQAIEEMKGS